MWHFYVMTCLTEPNGGTRFFPVSHVPFVLKWYLTLIVMMRTVFKISFLVFYSSAFHRSTILRYQLVQ
jgi:hypothetical protein